MSITSPAPLDAPPVGAPKIFRVGTLQYTQQQLYVLFFWLMWNDVMITLLEQPNQFAFLLQKANGMTYTQLALFGTVQTIVTFWINPVFSTWSDRTRTKWGRRRPFLFLTTPPLALFIATMPYMPDLFQHLNKNPWWAAAFSHIPMNGAAFLISVNCLVMGIFNAMVLAIFSYLYWDVVPQEVLGRFNSLAKIVTSALLILWNFFFLGLGQTHMKAVCTGISIFALVCYLVSVWKVREGEWPPPDEHTTGGWFTPIRAYFVECYSKPYYLWIFFALVLYSMSGASGLVKANYVMNEIHLSWDVVGKLNTAPLLIAVFLGYSFGSATDRLHPVRIFPWINMALAFVNLGSFIFIAGAWSYLIWSCLSQIVILAYGVAYGALLPEIYPMEKLGQFCSACVLFQAAAGLITGIPIGKLWDWEQNTLHNDRLAYLWSAIFLFAASGVWFKVLSNHIKRHGTPPVPHAG